MIVLTTVLGRVFESNFESINIFSSYRAMVGSIQMCQKLSIQKILFVRTGGGFYLDM